MTLKIGVVVGTTGEIAEVLEVGMAETVVLW